MNFNKFMEGWKPFPKDKVNRQIDKKKAEGNVGDSRTLRAVSNYKTRNTDFSKADQKFVGKDKAKSQAKKEKHASDAQRHWYQADHHQEKADKHERKKTEAKLSDNHDKADKHAKKEQKHLDKADKSERAGNRSANRHDTMTTVHKAFARGYRSDDKKQEAINKKSKEDRAKAKRMLAATGLESSYNKPAVSGAEKGFKKETMDFSHLKLVTEMLASGAGTSLTTNANNKASQQAQASKQASATSNSIGAQGTMMSSKPTKNNISSPVKQRTTAAPQPTASMATPTTTVEQWSFWRQRSEIHKMMKEQSSDWRKDLTEALGVKDEVFHPYVDIMPHGNAKLRDAQKKAVKAAGKEMMGHENAPE